MISPWPSVYNKGEGNFRIHFSVDLGNRSSPIVGCKAFFFVPRSNRIDIDLKLTFTELIGCVYF